MVTQHRVTRSIPLLCVLLACDPAEFEGRSADEVVDENDQGKDEASPSELVAAPGENRNKACADNCRAENFAFCFWNSTGCSGYRIAIPGGTEFDFTFSNDLRSLHKRDGTVRMALYDQNGKCLQNVQPGKVSLTALAVGTRRAKWNAVCP